jgi:poly-gamma-glutamate capsule biosynthesis protein CapA/YwtB (metallophosphatase superfamily)
MQKIAALGLIVLLGFGIGYAISGKIPPVMSPSGVTNEETPAPAPEPDRRVTFLAVGDIMLSRNVADKIVKSGDPLYPFRKMASILNEVDFSFANLESPFSGKDTFNPSPSLVFNAPRNAVEGLNKYKFKILNLANNHALDQGIGGIRYTREYLLQNGIEFIGAGENLDQAWEPKVLEVSGTKIGFVGASYASLNDNGKTTNNYVARIENTTRLKDAIEDLKTRSDFIVVTIHAGTEYKRNPNQSQIDFAYRAVDLGADIVIGAHPHWIQTIEQYNGKYIFYSLGDFIFDQEWSRETKEGLTLKISLKNRDLESIELIPVVIENYSTPRLASESEKKLILEKIGVTDPILTLLPQ